MMLAPARHTCNTPTPIVPEANNPDIAFRPSSLVRRLAGLVYDLVAVVAIVMVVGMLCQAATLGRLVETGSDVVIAWWYRPLQYLVVVAYFIVSWVRGGQTLGMRPWRMYLRMADGRSMGLRAAIIRACVASLPLLLLSLGHTASPRTAMLAALAAWVAYYAVALFDPQRRALHDIVAGTGIVHMVLLKHPQQAADQAASTKKVQP